MSGVYSSLTPPGGPIKYVGTFTTNSAGAFSQALMSGVRYIVQPMTAGEFANSLSVAGNVVSIQFKKFRAGGLGLNLGTLLSVSIFEDMPGAVTFNLFAAEDYTS